MAKNEFELVEAPIADGITLKLVRSATGEVAEVICPASATGGKLPKDYSSGPLAPKEALRSAIKLANELKAPIVVFDPDDLWQKEWGVLYKMEEDGGPNAA